MIRLSFPCTGFSLFLCVFSYVQVCVAFFVRSLCLSHVPFSFASVAFAFPFALLAFFSFCFTSDLSIFCLYQWEKQTGKKYGSLSYDERADANKEIDDMRARAKERQQGRA